ncbi:MAG: hypothetical protein RR998_03860 [Oscillospiraceae bacterium]
MENNNADNDLCEISAKEVTLTVTDLRTGKVFERCLPLDYYENHNGIRIRGEDMHARPSEIVLLSGQAVNQINDLMGNGPDTSRCGDEEY